jgi:elongation factor 3
MLSKASRALTEEDKRMMDTEITGKNGDKRRIEQVLGRQKLKKSFQYEVKFKGMDHRVSNGEPRYQIVQYAKVWPSPRPRSTTPGCLVRT